MKISIITVVHNNVRNIEECILSVLSQTYHNVEYIVVDGGSTDGTVDIINRYKNQISVFCSEKDEGLYDALNKGFLAATGDVIGILHSDDLFFHKTVLSDVKHSFTQNHIDVLYGDGVYCQRDDINKIKRVYLGGVYKKYKLYLGWMPLHTTMFVRREVFGKHGLYDKKYDIAGDYDICLRWFLDDNLTKHYDKSFKVIMRIGGRSTLLRLQKRKSTEDLSIIRKHRLLGIGTLFFKIIRKVPQYLIPYFNRKSCTIVLDKESIYINQEMQIHLVSSQQEVYSN